jgi:hypothetical protein
MNRIEFKSMLGKFLLEPIEGTTEKVDKVKIPRKNLRKQQGCQTVKIFKLRKHLIIVKTLSLTKLGPNSQHYFLCNL